MRVPIPSHCLLIVISVQSPGTFVCMSSISGNDVTACDHAWVKVVTSAMGESDNILCATHLLAISTCNNNEK